MPGKKRSDCHRRRNFCNSTRVVDSNVFGDGNVSARLAINPLFPGWYLVVDGQ